MHWLPAAGDAHARTLARPHARTRTRRLPFPFLPAGGEKGEKVDKSSGGVGGAGGGGTKLDKLDKDKEKKEAERGKADRDKKFRFDPKMLIAADAREGQAAGDEQEKELEQVEETLAALVCVSFA